MRRVSLAARRAQNFLRRPPRPRWVDPALVGASVAIALVVGAGTGLWVSYSGLLDATRDGLRDLALGLTGQAGLEVREVYAEGRVRTPADAVREQLGIAVGEPILGINTAAVQARLERLPWVERASVVRLLPDTISVRLVERRPLALWQEGGRFALIDRSGAVIPTAAPAAEHRNLRVLVGEQAPRHAAQLFALLSTEPALWARVVAASWVGERRWNLYLDNGVEVWLPEDDVAAAWRVLARHADESALLDRAIAVIDLRLLPERMHLRLDPAVLQERGA
jgi:cell division protein FtsQ